MAQQTVQILRTTTNVAPPTLPPGAFSVELGTDTRLWIGSAGGNRLLLSSNLADSPVSGRFLPLTGGVLSGPGNLTARGGVLVGNAGAVPSAGALTLNANTAAPAPIATGTNLYVVGADNTNARIEVDAYGTGATPALQARRTRGTAATPTAVQNGDTLLFLQGQGYAASAWGAAAPNIAMAASENWTATGNGASMYFATTPAGTTAGVNTLILAGNGATFSGGVGVGAAAAAPGNGALILNANTVAPPANGTFAAPSLEVLGATGAFTSICLDNFGTGAGNYIDARAARGTPGAPAASQNNDTLFLLAVQGHDGTAFGTFGHTMMRVGAAENWTTGAHGTQMLFATTPLGVNNTVNSLILQGNTAVFSGTVLVPGIFYFGAPPASAAANMSADATNVYFHPPSGGGGYFFQNTAASVNLLWVDNGGSITISGATAVKASGTAWANPSARDLKENIQPYDKGLAAILALQPRTYSFAASSGIDAAGEHIGLVHDETSHMPEMHRTLTIGSGDEAREVDGLDCSAITFALVNAIKELKAEIDALKGAP